KWREGEEDHRRIILDRTLLVEPVISLSLSPFPSLSLVKSEPDFEESKVEVEIQNLNSKSIGKHEIWPPPFDFHGKYECSCSISLSSFDFYGEISIKI
ncbi:hypothetical protein Dimus_002848, partial [Dionaea muscipula]